MTPSRSLHFRRAAISIPCLCLFAACSAATSPDNAVVDASSGDVDASADVGTVNDSGDVDAALDLDAATNDSASNSTFIWTAEPRPAPTSGTGCSKVNYFTGEATDPTTHVATRVTPPLYPYSVTEIAYYLFDGPISGTQDSADATHPHKVYLFKGTVASGNPLQTIVSNGAPASASDIYMKETSLGGQIQASKAGASGAVRLVKHTLSSPISLASGESLFVAIELAYSNGSYVGPLACFDGRSGAASKFSTNSGAPFTFAKPSQAPFFVGMR